MTMTADAAEASRVVVLRTPRLSLSPLSIGRAQALFEQLNDWEVAKNLSEVPWPLRPEDVADFIARQPSATSDDFVVLSTGGPIGVVSVKRPGSGDPPRMMPRLGYWFGRRHWGQGYATEAIGALVGYAFRAYPHERVGAGIFHDNPGSRRVLEKLGFTVAGTKTAMSRSRGGEVATIDMQVTRAEWVAALARRR